MTDSQNQHDAARENFDTYPLWTVRYTWAVLNADDQITCTYIATGSETEAVDRAVFALDRYENSGVRILVAAHVKRRDGWSDVPKSNTGLSNHSYIHAFQQPPTRPA